MYTFYYDKYPDEDLNRFYPSRAWTPGLIELIQQYDIKFNHISVEDTIKSSGHVIDTENSFMFINIASLLNYFFDNGEWAEIYNKNIMEWKNIKWALDNNLKIILDFSKEMAGNSTANWMIKNIALFETGLVKLLTNYKHKDTWFWDLNSDYNLSQYIIDSNYFEYDTRANYFWPNNISWNLKTYPVENKKYIYNMLIGDIYKPPNSFLYGRLLQNNLKDCGFVTTIIEKIEHKVNANFFDTLMWTNRWDHKTNSRKKVLDENDQLWFKENKEKILVHQPAEGPEVSPEMRAERRWFQQQNESHITYILEASPERWIPSLGDENIDSQNNFFTEKTFKPIMHGSPFFIMQGRQNKLLKHFYGYELYDELFDYSVEDTDTWNTINAVMDQIKHFKQHGIDTENKIIKEKVRYNQDLFMKRSSRESLENDLQRILSW